jgi:hypothetical protein
MMHLLDIDSRRNNNGLIRNLIPRFARLSPLLAVIFDDWHTTSTLHILTLMVLFASDGIPVLHQ